MAYTGTYLFTSSYAMIKVSGWGCIFETILFSTEGLGRFNTERASQEHWVKPLGQSFGV